MLILVPLLVLLLLAALFVAGGSTSDGGERFLRSGTGLPLVVIGMVAATVVAIAVAGLFLVGARGIRDDGSSDRDPPRSQVETIGEGKAGDDKAGDEKSADQPAEPVLAGAGPDVSVSAGTMSASPIDRLPDGAVLRVTASGFEPGSAGEVAQCVVTRDDARWCVNRFPVQFDGRGVARFQYLLSDRVRPAGRCGATDPPCILVVSDRVGGVQASTLTVFHDPAPLTGRVTVDPRSGLSKGDVVTVRASGFPPHTGIVATQCPEAPEGARCEPGVSARTGPDGGAVLRLTIKTSGTTGIACGRRSPCALRVVAEAAVPPVSTGISFSAGPSARYETGRLAAGLAFAALVLALAAWVVRTSDWRGPAEAATPEMDRAVLDS